MSHPGELLSTRNVLKKKTKSGNETFISSLALDSGTVAAMATLKKKNTDNPENKTRFEFFLQLGLLQNKMPNVPED